MNKRGFPFLILALLVLTAGTMGVAQAQVTPYPVTLTMSGPATAVSGQEITYRVHYQLLDPSRLARAGFRIPIPNNTTYVSTQVVFGPARLFNLNERSVDWGHMDSDETEGEVELTVKIDAEYLGPISGWAYVPGTETTNSNTVETQVFAPGTLPTTGVGGPEARSGPPVPAGLLALAGAALFCAGAGLFRV